MKTRLLVSLFALVTSAVACANGDHEQAAAPSPDAGGADATPFVDVAPQEVDMLPPDTCLELKIEAKELKLTMALLMDRSGSMQALDKWTSATKAIRTFVDRPDVVGLKFGLQYFPTLGMEEAGYCNTNAYKIFAVPVAPLPGNVLPIQQSLEKAQANGGGTPMAAGLAGTIAALRDLTLAETDTEGVVILVTDGDPNSCGDVPTVAAIAHDAANPTDGKKRVRTFAVGMEGASFASLDSIASAGSGTKSIDVGSGTKSADALVAALDKIRHDALDCEYALEKPDASKYKVDYTSVDVLFDDGATSERIKRVGGHDECLETTGGFYYDDPTNPTRVKLCDSTCAKVKKADPSIAKVQIDLGCVGVIQ
jgi:Mg-chelatase subunit ChlD